MELQNVYNKLYSHFGPQHWWPADTPFEVVVGAILTQNTSWKNVERAILNLKSEGVLDIEKIHRMPEERLQNLIQPSGFYRIKAKRLKHFIGFLFEKYEGDLDRLFALDVGPLRSGLLGINGIGKETADSIILYAAEKPSFVVDAYTKRVFERLGYLENDSEYDDIKDKFENNLQKDTKIYNEFHALIVALAKDICRKKPLCNMCPLENDCIF
jgi:endonuclease-3 related protein